MGGRGIGRAGAVIAGVLAGVCLGGTSTAAAGQFEILTCMTAPGFATDAFQGYTKSSRMKVVRACEEGHKPRGLITGNAKHAGRGVPIGDVALVVLAAPPGTVFTHVDWEGYAKRADCRYALQVFADGIPPTALNPTGMVPLTNVRADCPLKTHTMYQAASYKESANVTGATRIVQRAICVGAHGHGCSASTSNYIITRFANVTLHDATGPTVSIANETPLTSGQWVNGDQTLDYSASDNVGVRAARALIGGVDGGADATRRCAGEDGRYVLQVPCANGPGQINVNTRNVPEGTQSLVVRAEDAAKITGDSSPPLTVHIDNTPPARVDVAVDGGEEWRNSNDFSAVWSNPPEPDRAPVTGVRYKLCPATGSACAPEGDQAGEGIARLAMPVPRAGEWTLSLYRRDAAGNADPGYASSPVTLRYDPDPPQLAFEPPQVADPTRVSVAVTDALSGPAGGSIEIAREGSALWQGLVTQLEADHLVARVDDLALPPGTYLMRARASDRAGNEGSTDRRVDGQPVVVSLPLRVAARMEAAIAVQRGHRHPVTDLKPSARMRIGEPVRVAGRLVAPDGRGIADAEVQVLARSEAAPEHPVDVLRTGPDGRFEYATRADSSRTLRFLHAATPTVLPANAEISISVPAATTARVTPRRLRNGHAVRFSGRLRGLPPPPRGKLLELQVRFPTGWQTFRTIRTNSDGHWSARYRFARTRGVVRYRFRARIPREAGYPFETGVSHSVSVRVRGPR
jgi:hypothetical protein